MQETITFADPLASDSATICANDVLVWLLANGLARIGFERTLQGSPKSVKSADGTSWIDGNYWLSGKGKMFDVDPIQGKDWLKFHVKSTLEGYAYNTETVAPRVAIGILTLYCIIAVAHLFYSGISGTRKPPTSHLRFAILTVHVYRRHQLYLLGLDRRSYRVGHELHAYDGLTEHMCWHHGAAHLPASRARTGKAG